MTRPERHVIYEPEWVIDSSGGGSFRVECECGWEKSGFDTITRAKAAAFDHSAQGADAMPESTPADTRRRRFWQRG
ncbi:MAG TPA: hypothetical protein VF228_21165 [Iamia sp.]